MILLFMCLIGQDLFPDPAPSLRIQALGLDLAYYIVDTLTDIRINPLSAHNRLLYAMIHDTPAIGFADSNWVMAYSQDDDFGIDPYHPTYLTGTLLVSRRLGGLWPFLRITGRLLNGPGVYPKVGLPWDWEEGFEYYTTRNQLLLAFRPGMGFRKGNWECAISGGWGFIRDTFENISHHYGNMNGNWDIETHEHYKEKGSGFSIETSNRISWGTGGDWSMVFSCRVRGFSDLVKWRCISYWEDTLGQRDTSELTRGDTNRRYFGDVSCGAVRKISPGQSATVWTGFLVFWNWKVYEEGTWCDFDEIERVWVSDGKVLLLVPCALEMGFGSENRLFLRFGGGLSQEIFLYKWPPSVFETRVSMNTWGLGFSFHDKLRIDLFTTAKDMSYWPSYEAQITYCF